MKRRYVIFFVLIILSAAVYGWISYRDLKSYKNVIPSDADLIIKINADQLFWKGAKYLASHPSELFKDQNKQTESEAAVENGLAIPANIFFYTRKGNPNVMYASLPVKDKAIAKEFIGQNFNIEEFTELEDEWRGISANKKYSVSINDKRAAFSYSLKKGEGTLTKELLSTLHEDVPENKIMEALSGGDGDITILYDDIEINISTKRENILLEGKIPSENFDIRQVPFIGSLTASSWNADVQAILKNSVKVFIELKSTVSKTDTITSYEFNEDFEKIETSEIKTYLVPGVAFQIELNPEIKKTSNQFQTMNSYLQNSGLHLKEESGQTYVYTNSDSLQGLIVDHRNLVWLKIDLNSFDQDMNLFSDKEFFKNIETLEFRAIKNEDETVSIHSELIFRENVVKILLDYF